MTPRLASLVAAVQLAVDDIERELSDVPFFMRGRVKRGFEERTGRTHAEWRAALAQVETIDRADLERLFDHFVTTPDRARRGPAGNSATAMRIIEARSTARADAVRALITALR